MQNKFYDIIFKLDNLSLSVKNIDKISIHLEEASVRKYFFYNILSFNNFTSWLIPLYKKDFFNIKNHPQNKNYKTYTPYWEVLEYLHKVAEQNEQNHDNEITETLIKIIEPAIEKSKDLKNYRTNYYLLITISCLPLDIIKDCYFTFMNDALKIETDLIVSVINDKLLPKILENKDIKLLVKLLECILTYRTVERESVSKSYLEYQSILGDYWFQELLDRYKEQIIELAGFELILIVIKLIKSIININENDFNHIWIPTIEEHPQSDTYDKYEYILVKLLRDALESQSAEKIKNIIKSFLDKEHYIFPRLAIYIINLKYNEINSLLWEIEGNLIEKIGVKHELYELFKAHSHEFSEEQLFRVIDWIESIDYYKDKNELTDEQKEIYIAYTKKEWYSSLLNSKSELIKKNYEKYNIINPVKLDHPGHDTWFEGGFVGYNSPYSSVQINEMPLNKLIDELNNFTGKDGWGKPSIDGFADELRRAVLKNPQRYLSNIELFKDVKLIYLYYFFMATSELVRTDVNIIINLVQFIGNSIYILKRCKKFENKEVKKEKLGRTYDVIITTIRIFADIVNNDSAIINKQQFDAIGELFIFIDEVAEPSVPEMKNIISHVMNYPRGELYRAYILYSLRYARQFKPLKEQRWLPSIKSKIEKYLSVENHDLELYTVLGEYLPNIHYLDSQWIIENNKVLFPEDYDPWEALMTGYLYRNRKLYKEIYNILNEYHQYEKMISYDFKHENAKNQFVRHVIIAYIEGWDDINDKSSLVSKMLDGIDIAFYQTIGHFIWASRENLKKDPIKIDKIKSLWIDLNKHLKAKESDPKEKETTAIEQSATSFLDWLVYFDRIDKDLLPAVQFSAKYIKHGRSGFNFLENINRFVSAQPDVVGELFISIIGSDNFLSYRDEDVKTLVEKLYAMGQKEYADTICNKYGEKGAYFLKDTYFKNQG